MLSQEQKEYIAARDHFQSVKARVRQETTGTYPSDDAGRDAYIEREIQAEGKHGYLEAFNRLEAAEQALIAWTQGVMQHHPSYEKIAPAFRAKGKHKIELIELCLQLDAKSAEKLVQSASATAAK